MTTRRAMVASLVSAAALTPLTVRSALAQSVGDIRIDLSALRGDGWGRQALAVIDASLRRALGAPTGGGPTLIVRVTSVKLGAFAGANGGNGGRRQDEGTNDYMEGELIVAGRGNAILSRQPLLSALDPSGSGAAWWSNTNELRRLDALATSYGYWARRRAG